MTMVDRVHRIVEAASQKADRDLIDLEIAAEAAKEIADKLWSSDTVPTAADMASVIYRHMKGGM